MGSWAIGAGLWAQAASGQDPTAVAGLALRRWCATLTLSSPEPVPRPYGVVAWLAGLGALLLLAIVAQGPLRALGQFFDLVGLIRLGGDAFRRLRRASRLVVVLLGATVIGWTGLQVVSWNDPNRLAELTTLVLKTKTLTEVVVEQGFLSAVVPLRDVLGLSNNVLLVVAVGAVIFRFSAERWGVREPAEPGTRWATLYWGVAWLYAIDRFVGLLVEGSGLPLGGCFPLEALLAPAAMALTDGMILAWILVELRGAERPDAEALDVTSTLALVPAASWASVLTLPAFYVAAGASLLAPWIKSLPTWMSEPIRPLLTSLVLGWGPVALQAAALPMLGVLGATAWTRRGPGRALRGFWRLARAEGGRIAALVAVASAACGGVSAAAYALVLSLPKQPWVLAAADSYAHYATLPIGLLTLAALVELGRRVPDPDLFKEPPPPEPVVVAEPVQFLD